MTIIRCPRCNQSRDANDGYPADTCPYCGVIYRKAKPRPQPVITHGYHQLTRSERLADVFLPPEKPFDSKMFGGRFLVWLLLVVWSFYLLPDSPQRANPGFWHNIHLPFHEFGHLAFRPFGDFMATLGGTLGQLLMPLVVMGTFLLKERNAIGGVVGLWWLGHSFMDVAPYAYDARDRVMILIGGVTGRDRPDFHDWHHMLRDLGLLHWDHALGHFFNNLGRLLMVTALLWGGYALYRAWCHR